MSHQNPWSRGHASREPVKQTDPEWPPLTRIVGYAASDDHANQTGARNGDERHNQRPTYLVRALYFCDRCGKETDNIHSVGMCHLTGAPHEFVPYAQNHGRRAARDYAREHTNISLLYGDHGYPHVHRFLDEKWFCERGECGDQCSLHVCVCTKYAFCLCGYYTKLDPDPPRQARQATSKGDERFLDGIFLRK
jgi:hypothetical protein